MSRLLFWGDLCFTSGANRDATQQGRRVGAALLMLIQEDVQGGGIMEIKRVKSSKSSEETEKQLHSSAKNSLDIAFDSAIDFELDFDLDDFDLTLGEKSEDEGGFKTRIMPRK